jgi:alpha-1,3-glucan synthase
MLLHVAALLDKRMLLLRSHSFFTLSALFTFVLILGDHTDLYLGMMTFNSIAFLFPIVITLAASLNDSSVFWCKTAQSRSSSECRVSVHGPFDNFGVGSSVPSKGGQDTHATWQYDLMAELPSRFQLSMLDRDVNNNADWSQTFRYVDGATHSVSVLPASVTRNVIHITKLPSSPHLGYRLSIDGARRQYIFTPIGSSRYQIMVYFLLGIIPISTGFASIWIYWYAFCVVKVYKFSRTKKNSFVPTSQSKLRFGRWFPDTSLDVVKQERAISFSSSATACGHRTILIATMEYEIYDWNVKISVGGLGFMTQIMSQSLGNQDLLWIVPCVQGVHYPQDQRAEPMKVKISGVIYTVQVQYHRFQNITYVLLDAPVFRAQTVTDPYPLGADDMHSAIYYSTW